MNTIRSHSEAGDFRRGYFYSLRIPLDDGEFDPEPPPEGTIVGQTGDVTNGTKVPILYAEVVEERHQLFGCKRDPTHVTAWTRQNVAVDLFGGPYIGDFVYDCTLSDTLVSTQMKARLLFSDLKGFSFSDPLPVACNQSVLPWVEIFMLRPEGADCTRPFVNEPPGDNRCPFCGWGPVVCPECHRLVYTCEACKQSIVVALEDYDGPHDPRFVITPLSHEDLIIIDGRNWDGKDFIALGDVAETTEMIVTRRVVDWLLRTKSVPFIAEPCRLDVTGMTRSQLRQLEDMEKRVC